MIKNESRPLTMLLAVMLWFGYAQAQESSNSSGGNATGISGTVAYSIGQVTYTTNTGSSGNIAQGVQHAYGIFTSGNSETTLNISLNVFPNPTSENLTIQISDFSNEKLSYQIYDALGKQITNGKIVGPQTHINTSILPASTYFINVVNKENKNVKSFKIIKTL
jgi:hypothetical protein